jgi:hypothetical protein
MMLSSPLVDDRRKYQLSAIVLGIALVKVVS